MASIGWNEDWASEAKARRAAPSAVPVTAEQSVVAKAFGGLAKREMPWATTHDENTDDEPGTAGTSNIQGEQVPLRLSKVAKGIADALRKGEAVKPIDEYGMRAPMGKDDGDDMGGGDVEMAEKAEWTGAYVNTLPDSSFLYIGAGGTKDDEGKTTPRDLRHFPVKDKDGEPDAAHVRNALARIPQSNLPEAVKATCAAAASKLLDKINGETEKAAWPSDLSAAAKGRRSRRDAAIAKSDKLMAKDDDNDLGQDARDHTKVPNVTDRGRIQDGAVPVRQVAKDSRVAKSVSFGDVARALQAALDDRYPKVEGHCLGPWCRDVFDDAVVYEYDGKLYRLPYVFNGGTVVLGGTPALVQVSYIPVV